MITINEICRFMDEFAPEVLAEPWDNTGLLVGDRERQVNRILTCLTITGESAREAVEQKVELIITHHPLPFQPLNKLTTDNTVGTLLLELIESKIAVFSPHTRFDSAKTGINQKLAERIGLAEIEPLISLEPPLDSSGSGRVGRLGSSTTLQEFAQNIKSVLGCSGIHVVGDLAARVSQVAIACGSGGSFMDAASERGCDALVTGETNFHTCLEAKASGVSLVLLGHFASERFGLEHLAQRLSSQFPSVNCWASCNESDPIVWI